MPVERKARRAGPGGDERVNRRQHSPIDALLSRLPDARRMGPDRWIALCPAHDDRSPSLAIREIEDGRVLLHCFAGCETRAVVQALGLELPDLFPPDPRGPEVTGRPHREARPFNAADALACLDFEAALVYLAARDLAAGRGLSEADRKRLLLAARRIAEARHVVA